MPNFAKLSHKVWTEVAPEITPKEFHHPELMSADFVYRLSRVRRAAQVPFRFVSDARDPLANEAAGGAKDSAHQELPCSAVDLHVKNNFERFHIVAAAIKEGLTRIGVYPAKDDNSGSVHLDDSVDNPQERIWTRY